jgi:hypothetical protein
MDDAELVTDPGTSASGYRFGYEAHRMRMLAAAAVVFISFWACQFLADISALTTSLSMTEWYFTRDKAKYDFKVAIHAVSRCLAFRSLSCTRYMPSSLAANYTVWRCHAGTVALGSLIHTLTDVPHRFFATMDTFTASKIGKGTSSNPIRRLEQSLAIAFGTFLRYGTLGIVDNFLKYTSANVYMGVAMFGTGYWSSAKFSFHLIIRNMHRLGSTISVAQIIPTIGKVSATSCCTAVFYGIQVVAFEGSVLSIVAATVMAAVVSWIVSAQFLAPLTQAPTTLLQCYMLDEELFLHNDNERYAEKEMHAWVSTYGGEYQSQEGTA